MITQKQHPRQLSRQILILWMLLATFLLGSADRVLVSESSLLAMVPMLCFLVFLLFHKDFSITDCFRKENRTAIFISALLTVLTLLMLSIFSQLQSKLFSDIGLQSISWRFAIQRRLFLLWNYTGFLGAEILSIYCCWFSLQEYFLEAHEKARTALGEKQLPFHIQRWTLLIAIVGLICLFSVNPGFYDQADTGVIWHSVVDGKWNDDHPISFLFFIKACTLLVPSRRVISLVFYVAWLLVSNMAIEILEETKPGSGKIYAILSCLLFYPLFYLQTMVKDVAYAMALFALGMQILRFLRQTKNTASDWVVFGVSAFFALSFRHDGILPVLLTFLGVGIYVLIKQKKLVKPLCITVASVFALHLLITQGLAFGLMKVEKTGAYHSFGTPMAILAAVVESGAPIDDKDTALLEELMPLSDWAEAPRVSRYTVDMVSRTWGIPGDRIERVDTALGMQYVRLALKYLLRYPAVELRAFFQLNSIVWQIARPEDASAIELTRAVTRTGRFPTKEPTREGITSPVLRI